MTNETEEIMKLCKNYKRLKQYKDKSEAELMKIATIAYNNKVDDIELTGKFKSRKERDYAKMLAKKYKDDYAIETISDKNMLNMLIFYEVLHNRIQEKFNSFFEEEDKAVPVTVYDMITKNTKMITDLKSLMGLNKTKQEKTGYDALEHYKKRVKSWMSENQASRYFQCGHCGQPNLLRISSEHWEAQKHPFFKDRVLYNKHLIQMYKDGKIMAEDVAEVLECSPDYIDWVINKIEQSDKKLEAEKQKEEEEKIGE